MTLFHDLFSKCLVLKFLSNFLYFLAFLLAVLLSLIEGDGKYKNGVFDQVHIKVSMDICAVALQFFHISVLEEGCQRPLFLYMNQLHEAVTLFQSKWEQSLIKELKCTAVNTSASKTSIIAAR